jgi:hypothetical protein
VGKESEVNNLSGRVQKISPAQLAIKEEMSVPPVYAHLNAQQFLSCVPLPFQIYAEDSHPFLGVS